MEIREALSYVKVVRGQKNKTLASLLDELEQVLDPNSDEFAKSRRLVLDHFNDFYRAVFRLLLGVETDGK